MKGYVGEALGNYTMLWSGTFLKCDVCRSTTGGS